MMAARKINQIIIHCSASPFGSAAVIHGWHTDPKPKGRGWSDNGYHYILGNGHPKTTKRYVTKADGLIEKGRPLERAGAHAKGHNRNSIGICLIGTSEGLFTPLQIKALRGLVDALRAEYGLAVGDVIGHRDVEPAKVCPAFDVGAWV